MKNQDFITIRIELIAEQFNSKSHYRNLDAWFFFLQIIELIAKLTDIIYVCYYFLFMFLERIIES